jgi:hypothetical protein
MALAGIQTKIAASVCRLQRRGNDRAAGNWNTHQGDNVEPELGKGRAAEAVINCQSGLHRKLNQT